jgi:DNA-binding transcriptional LysR family regulator
MIELARAGMGVGILPRWSAQRAIGSSAVVALSITRRGLRRRWAAGTLAAQTDPPYIDDFTELIAERALPVRSGARESA